MLEKRRDERRVAIEKKYYAKNRERILAKQRADRAKDPTKSRMWTATHRAKIRRENPAKAIWQVAGRNAKARGKEFDITVEDVEKVMMDICPVFGTPMGFGEAFTKDDRPSIDRIDSSKGYVKGNVQIISWRANHLKNDATLEELEKLVAYMRKQQGER